MLQYVAISSMHRRILHVVPTSLGKQSMIINTSPRFFKARRPHRDTPPPILYKYYSPERLSIFEEPSVRFSSPDAFNDAFDSYAPDVRIDGEPIRTARQNLGIVCLTEEPNDHVMWVHYGAQHTGFVIGFDTSDEVFKSEGATLDYVRYEPTPKPMPTGIRHCFYKGEEWDHESEWRCVRVFPEGQLRDVPVKKTAIRELIIGRHMKAYHIVQILRHVESSESGFKLDLNFAQLDSISRSVQVTPFPLTICTSCHGYGLRYR